MKKFKNKGMGFICGFGIILFHAVGHWLTEQYQYDEGFHRFIVDVKSAIFHYFNSGIPLKITIGVSAFMVVMSIVSAFWRYND